MGMADHQMRHHDLSECTHADKVPPKSNPCFVGHVTTPTNDFGRYLGKLIEAACVAMCVKGRSDHLSDCTSRISGKGFFLPVVSPMRFHSSATILKVVFAKISIWRLPVA